MGLLRNLWYGHNHEVFDQMALALAEESVDLMRELRAQGMEPQDILAHVIEGAGCAVEHLQDRGLNVAGWARLMHSFEHALVMKGLSRRNAHELKVGLRKRAPGIRIGGSPL